MKVTPKQYAQLLYETTKDEKGSGLTKVVKTFVQLLIKNRALAQFARIERMYRDYYNAQEGIVDVEVVSARETTKKVMSDIGKQLGGGNIEIKACEDPTVLGGARIKVGDYMIDDTLKSRLTQLKQRIYGR